MESGTVLIVGAGFVGMSAAALFASHLAKNKADRVVIFDLNRERIRSHVRAIELGDQILGEPGLCSALRPNTNEIGEGARCPIELIEPIENQPDQLTFIVEDLKPSLIVCAVNTPAGDGPLYMGNVEAVIDQVLNATVKYEGRKKPCFVIRSTAQPTAVLTFEAQFEESQFGFAVVPEFLREGRAYEDTFSPERIVIGASSDHQVLMDWFAPRGQNGPKGERYDLRPYEAALVKVAGNAFLAAKAQFAHAVGRLAGSGPDECFDAHRVLAAIGGDSRIGASFLRPSLGIGGSCLPKDFLAFGAEADAWINATRTSHFNQTTRELVSRICGILCASAYVKKDLSAWIYGAGFKPDCFDPRESAAVLMGSLFIGVGIDVTIIERRVNEISLFEQITVDGFRLRKDKYCSKLILQDERFNDSPEGNAVPSIFVINQRMDMIALNIIEAMIIEKKRNPKRTFVVVDPHADVNSTNVACIRSSQIRYLGGGRGERWLERTK